MSKAEPPVRQAIYDTPTQTIPVTYDVRASPATIQEGVIRFRVKPDRRCIVTVMPPYRERRRSR